MTPHERTVYNSSLSGDPKRTMSKACGVAISESI